MTLSERKGGTEETGCRDQEEANKAPRVQTPRAPWPPATALCCLALVPYLAARSDTGWGGEGAGIAKNGQVSQVLLPCSAENRLHSFLQGSAPNLSWPCVSGG